MKTRSLLVALLLSACAEGPPVDEIGVYLEITGVVSAIPEQTPGCSETDIDRAHAVYAVIGSNLLAVASPDGHITCASDRFDLEQLFMSTPLVELVALPTSSPDQEPGSLEQWVNTHVEAPILDVREHNDGTPLPAQGNKDSEEEPTDEEGTPLPASGRDDEAAEDEEP
jgi:hypothetical protein